MYQIKKSSTAYPLVFLMVDSSDHISPKTGLTCTVTISKAGASFGSPSGSVTEIANGWYKVAGNATDSNTDGPLVLHSTATGADPSDVIYQVVEFDPNDPVRLGLTALPNANAAASGGLPTIDSNLEVKTTVLRTLLTSLYGTPGSVGYLLATQLFDFQEEMDAIHAHIDAVPSELLDGANSIETGYSLRKLLQITAAVLGGKLSGAAGTTITFRNLGDTTDVVVATVDSSGDRSALTYTFPSYS